MEKAGLLFALINLKIKKHEVVMNLRSLKQYTYLICVSVTYAICIAEPVLAAGIEDNVMHIDKLIDLVALSVLASHGTHFLANGLKSRKLVAKLRKEEKCKK